MFYILWSHIGIFSFWNWAFFKKCITTVISISSPCLFSDEAHSTVSVSSGSGRLWQPCSSSPFWPHLLDWLGLWHYQHPFSITTKLCVGFRLTYMWNFHPEWNKSPQEDLERSLTFPSPALKPSAEAPELDTSSYPYHSGSLCSLVSTVEVNTLLFFPSSLSIRTS